MLFLAEEAAGTVAARAGRRALLELSSLGLAARLATCLTFAKGAGCACAGVCLRWTCYQASGMGIPNLLTLLHLPNRLLLMVASLSTAAVTVASVPWHHTGTRSPKSLPALEDLGFTALALAPCRNVLGLRMLEVLSCQGLEGLQNRSLLVSCLP